MRICTYRTAAASFACVAPLVRGSIQSPHHETQVPALHKWELLHTSQDWKPHRERRTGLTQTTTTFRSWRVRQEQQIQNHAMASETSLGPLENPLCFCLPCQQGEMIVLLFHKMDWTVNYYKNRTPKIRIKIVKKYEKYAKPLNRTTRASQAEADEKLFSETRKGIIKFSLEREIINTVNKTSLGEKAANRQTKIKVLIRPQTTLKNTWARHKVLHVNLLMPPESLQKHNPDRSSHFCSIPCNRLTYRARTR